jgi:hypothetical protein
MSDTNSFAELAEAATQDFLAAAAEYQKDDSQYRRRALLRAFFAFAEVCQDSLRRACLITFIARFDLGAPFNISLASLLVDEVPQLDATGRIKLVPARPQFLPYFAFILRTAAEQTGEAPDKFFSNNGWAEFKRAVEIRHRITHPAGKRSLDISDDDMRTMVRAKDWLLNDLIPLMARHPAAPIDLTDREGGV